MDEKERAATQVVLAYVTASARHLADQMATRGQGAAKRRKWERETNKYQQELGETYDDWLTRVSREIAAAETDDERNLLITLALALLLADLRSLGREYIFVGMNMGLGKNNVSPRILEEIAEHIRDNEKYLEFSLLPEVERRLRNAVLDPDIMEIGALAIFGAMMGLRARTERYAGGMWVAINKAAGDVARQQGSQGEDERVFWKIEPTAQHCKDCLMFGDREYESFDRMLLETGGAMPGSGVQCNGNCRCELRVWRNGAWVRP